MGLNSMNNGKQGEQLFARIMAAKGYSVIDVSNEPLYQIQDIDFIVTSSATGAIKTFEVKWDSCINRTGNLYLELTNINSKQWNGEGWFLHCNADYLAYGDAVSGQFYIIPVNELRIAADKVKYRQGQCGYESTGQLVSLNDISDITQTLI